MFADRSFIVHLLSATLLVTSLGFSSLIAGPLDNNEPESGDGKTAADKPA